MVSSPTYRYQSLPEYDTIRLLKLQPSINIDTEPERTLISTTLRACDKDLVEHYTALSYVWGSASNKKTILLEGRPLANTTNLDSALRHIRDPKRSRLIWADAVCINQSDIDEKKSTSSTDERGLRRSTPYSHLFGQIDARERHGHGLTTRSTHRSRW